MESLDIGETNADDSCLHALSVSENKSTVVLLGLFGCCLITHMGVDYLQVRFFLIYFTHIETAVFMRLRLLRYLSLKSTLILKLACSYDFAGSI